MYVAVSKILTLKKSLKQCLRPIKPLQLFRTPVLLVVVVPYLRCAPFPEQIPRKVPLAKLNKISDCLLII